MNIDSLKFLAEAARSFSVYSAIGRAIAHSGDGLKASQRIALWCMRNEREKVKTFALAGRMQDSRLYVHGDATDTISRLAAPFNNNTPVLDGKGLFGTITAPMAFGAGRYTAVSRSKYFDDVLNVDANLIKLVPSVDGEAVMGETFLPLLPHALHNGVSGVGVGYSTEILPHKLSDLRKAVEAVLKDKPFPSFDPFFEAYPTIGIHRLPGDKEAYELTGVVEIKNTSTVEITAIPPLTSIESVQANLDALEEKKLITSYDNYSADEIRIVVKFPRAVLASHNVKSLIKLFKLRARVTQRLVMVDFDGSRVRKFADVEEYIRAWVEWRRPFIRERYVKRAEKIKFDADFYRAFIYLFEARFPGMLEKVSSKAEMQTLIKSLLADVVDNMSDEMLNRIMNVATYRWTIEGYEDANAELTKLNFELEETNAVINSEALQNAAWMADMKNLKF